MGIKISNILHQPGLLRRKKYFKTNAGKKTLKLMLKNSLKEVNFKI
jgi:hypothetical protein